MLIKKELLTIGLPDIPKELQRKKKQGWLALAQQVGDILAVTVYLLPERQVQARWFCDGKNSIKWKAGHWESCSLDHLLGRYYKGINHQYPDEPSESIAKAFFEASKDVNTRYGTLISWCNQWDSTLKSRQRYQRQDNEYARMRKHFDAFPPLPADIDVFADRHMPQYLFYSKIQKNGKRTAVCSLCGKRHTVAKDVPAHKKACTCPKCGAQATWQREWITPSKSHHAAVWTLVKGGEDRFWRVTTVYRRFDPNNKKIFRRYDNRRMFETTERGKQKTYNYNETCCCYSSGWKRAPFDQVCQKDAWIYTDNLPQVLGDTFCRVPTAALATISHQADLYFILRCLEEKPCAEYLAKAGMWRLLQQQATLNYTIEIPHHLRRLARKYDVDFYELQHLSKIGIVSDDRFEAVRRIRGGSFGQSEAMERYGIDTYIRHFGRWNNMYPKVYYSQIEQWYKDYLAMCDELKVDLHNKSVRWPKDIKLEHDRLAGRLSEIRNKDENEYFTKRVRELYCNMSGYSDKEYTVVFPMHRTSLTAEGQSLNHCVGRNGYRDEHLKGEKMIFFIRAADEPERPLYTLQANVKDGTIIQLYGYGDRPAPKKVHDFCKRFLDQLWGTEQALCG